MADNNIASRLAGKDYGGNTTRPSQHKPGDRYRFSYSIILLKPKYASVEELLGATAYDLPLPRSSDNIFGFNGGGTNIYTNQPSLYCSPNAHPIPSLVSSPRSVLT